MTAKCKYFRRCGGCSAQHIPYETQIDNKKKAVMNELTKNDIEFSGNIEIFHNKEYNYRNRMEFFLSAQGPGLRMKGKWHTAVPIRRCEISNEKINKLLKEVWAFFEDKRTKIDTFDNKKFKGTIKYTTLRAAENTDSTTISFIMNEESNKLGEQIDLVQEFAEKSKAKNVVVGRLPANRDTPIAKDAFEVKGSLLMQEKVLGKEIEFSSQSFFQNNTLMAEKMIQYCKDILTNYDTKQSTLIDYYGGAGTFGITLAELFKETFIIDNDKENIEYAKENIKRNKLHNIKAKCSDASTAKTEINTEEKFLITDPPRSGMHKKAIEKIVKLKPKIIIYISCNPAQMAKELRTFQKYYKIKSISAFDLFPQTIHTEAVAELEKL